MLHVGTDSLSWPFRHSHLLWDGLSVCCEYILLPSVNKEAALAYVKTGYSHVGNPREIEGEWWSWEDTIQLPKEQDASRPVAPRPCGKI